ncbi:MAG: hypothetical protein ACHQ2Y_04290 [Candidatus Lutacidiplasmatales archaeon]
MVYIKDEGSHFDAPIATVWKYIQSPPDHGASHKSVRNAEMKPLTENSFVITQEQLMNGQWVKVANRITIHPPLAMVIEVIEGPMTGTRMVNIYTEKGGKTGIDVYGEFTSPHLPATQIEGVARANLETVFNEDSVSIREFVAKK